VFIAVARWAARDGDLPLVQRFAAQGHVVSEKFNGVTPYDIANINGRFDIMQWIQQNGGDGHGSTGEFTFSFDSGDFTNASQIRHMPVSKGHTVHMMNDERHESWKENWKRSARYSGTQGRGVVMFYSKVYEARVRQEGSSNACKMDEFDFIASNRLWAEDDCAARRHRHRYVPGALSSSRMTSRACPCS